MRHPKTQKHSYLWTLPNEMENLKLSRKMRLEKEDESRIPPTYIVSRPLNEKLTSNPIYPGH
jgi:hypothetical protein